MNLDKNKSLYFMSGREIYFTEKGNSQFGFCSVFEGS